MTGEGIGGPGPREQAPEQAPEVVILVGPTASGKSALALRLASELGGTVVNADSMQVYRDLRILTARPSARDEAAVAHRLYGVLDGAEPCSAARWRELALAAIEEAVAAGRRPILVGGTGLYVRALLDGLAEVPPVPGTVREEAAQRLAALGGPGFRDVLARFDPDGAARLAPGDTQRLIRAYEVVVATGKPLSAWQAAGRAGALRRSWRGFVLSPDRAALRAAVDARLERMIADGAVAEVRALLARGLDPALPVMRALGVPELCRHVAGELSLVAAVTAAQVASRQYAKRQDTWFRHQAPGFIRLQPQFSNHLDGGSFVNILQSILTAVQQAP